MSRLPPGWYPDPARVAALRYWDGDRWTERVDTPRPSVKQPVSLEKIVGIPYAVVFGGLAIVMALIGRWDALAGVAVLAVLVGGPLALILLVTRRARQARRDRAQRREYEAGLVARFDHAAAAEADQFGGLPNPTELPDAEQMRQRAWQPDIPGSPAVRPQNPAPWHVVTQYPTRQFRAQDDEPRQR